ncbi:amidohydrolase family protein [Oricola cellulosilytica]|uniref:Amidohydrolase n=1 Tax=Oricola cellulosilytica TaxID=1429082 RepID=A0A4R0P7H0_9HYPH|nr:amidohydrolase family protein [Oricola cellulosilytica]TCD11874.1 amidohydrolase [Oricola cellulosilytica]
MPDFPIIDTHLHIWNTDALDYPWLEEAPKINRSFLLEDFDAATAGVDVEAMVFLQCEAHPSQAYDEAAWVASEARRDPRIRAMVPWAPVEKGKAVANELEGLGEFDILRGVRRIIQFEPDLEFCLRPDFIEGVHTVGQFGLTFDICIDYRQMANAILFARQCPDVAMVLDHIGKPNIKDGEIEPWASQMHELAKLPNVWCKLSGVATEADHESWTREDLNPFISTAVEAFGFERLMFGGDWPVSTQAIAYPQWIETIEWAIAGLSDSDARKLFRDNAKGFYRID